MRGQIKRRKLMEALKWFPINYLDSYNNAIIIDFQLFFHHRPKILFLHVAVKWNGLFDAMETDNIEKKMMIGQIKCRN